MDETFCQEAGKNWVGAKMALLAGRNDGRGRILLGGPVLASCGLAHRGCRPSASISSDRGLTDWAALQIRWRAAIVCFVLAGGPQARCAKFGCWARPEPLAISLDLFRRRPGSRPRYSFGEPCEQRHVVKDGRAVTSWRTAVVACWTFRRPLDSGVAPMHRESRRRWR